MEPPEQTKGGRPPIGGSIPGMELGEELKARVERRAAAHGVNRTEAIRTLLTRALDWSSGRVFVATVRHTGETYKFRSLDALARRTGGTTYEVQSVAANVDTDSSEPIRIVTVKRGSRRIFDVEVPAEAVENS